MNCCLCDAELKPEELGTGNRVVTLAKPTEFERRRFGYRATSDVSVERQACNKCLDEIYKLEDPGPVA
jgi:hypothetical protein